MKSQILKSEKICRINLKKSTSWKNKIFFTFDLDWCSDFILSYTLDIIEKYNIRATFFVTHQSKILNRMRENPNIELGIHPNFNPLLEGNYQNGKNYYDVLKFYKKIIPDAKSVRCHSLTHSSKIISAFKKEKLIYECNTLIPFSSKITLKPYKHLDKNIIRVPFFWEDDVHCAYNWKWDIKKFVKKDGLKVFNFHPIHIFLNTYKLNIYEKNKKFMSHKKKNILKLRYKGYGVYNFLTDLINYIK